MEFTVTEKKFAVLGTVSVEMQYFVLIPEM